MRRAGLAPAAVAVIERQATHLARLVDDLLDLARITHGKITLRKETVELGRVVADAVQASESLIARQRQQLILSLAAEPLHVEGDPTRLAQVVANLLNNAARYTPEGGRIELRTQAADDSVLLCVCDQGIGIAPDMLRHIFDPFTQAAPPGRGGGLGIGLALVQGLVQLHGGQVTARSAGPGRGSEFEVCLPRVEAPAPAAAEPPRRATGPQHILLVEDNEDARTMLAELLRLGGHEVTEAGSGRAGLEQLRHRPPALALVDIGLPDMTGYEVARAARATPDGRDVFLVALTGYGQAEDRRRALEAGFDDHVVKPVDEKQLLRLLAHAAEPRRGGAAIPDRGPSSRPGPPG